MLALCFMLSSPYYAKIYASIIDLSLTSNTEISINTEITSNTKNTSNIKITTTTATLATMKSLATLKLWDGVNLGNTIG